MDIELVHATAWLCDPDRQPIDGTARPLVLAYVVAPDSTASYALLDTITWDMNDMDPRDTIAAIVITGTHGHALCTYPLETDVHPRRHHTLTFAPKTPKEPECRTPPN